MNLVNRAGREETPGIREDELAARAYRLYDSFYEATREYRDKCRQNEAFWRANHWQTMPRRDEEEPRPVTPVLFSTLEAVLADIMDHYPTAVLLGETPVDDAAAERLTQLVRYVLARGRYRRVYRRKCRDALMKGTSVQEVFWDPAAQNGLGDVAVRDWDIKQFVWDPKFENFQDGRACFKFSHYPREWYTARYPRQAEMIMSDRHRREGDWGAATRMHEEDIMLLEYWWREEGYARVHMAKLAGGVVLEDSRLARPMGMYAHGKYPFVMESLYPMSGQPVGIGFVDVLGNLQQYADQLDQIILKNTLMSGQLKLLVNRAADLDEEALLDGRAEVVRGARIDEGAVRWMQAAPLSPYVVGHQMEKVRAVKEESGQNLFNRGETSGGVTAATAILALQEGGNKRSRMLVEQMYDGFEELVRMLCAVIIENYSEARVFRAGGEDGALLEACFDGLESGFDVRVEVEKQTPYSTLYQNELAMQLMQSGVLTSGEALELMQFEGRDKVIGHVRRRYEEVR